MLGRGGYYREKGSSLSLPRGLHSWCTALGSESLLCQEVLGAHRWPASSCCFCCPGGPLLPLLKSEHVSPVSRIYGRMRSLWKRSESLCAWNWAFASWGFLKCPWGKFGLWWVSDPFPKLWSMDGLLSFLQSPLPPPGLDITSNPVRRFQNWLFLLGVCRGTERSGQGERPPPCPFSVLSGRWLGWFIPTSAGRKQEPLKLASR